MRVRVRVGVRVRDDALRLHGVVHLLLSLLLLLARALALVLGLLELEECVDLAQVERGTPPRDQGHDAAQQERQRDDDDGEALEARLPPDGGDVLHLEHVRQAKGEGCGGDEREEHREDGEGGDVQPDQVDGADVGRLDARIEEHAHLVRVRGVGVKVRGSMRTWLGLGGWG